MPLVPKLLEIEISPFTYLIPTGITMSYPKDSSQLPLVWADGRAHCASFFRISPAEKAHLNGSHEVKEHAKLHLWNDFQPNLPMDPGENPRKGLK